MIKAPEGKVLKGYLISTVFDNRRPERVLVDEYGTVFIKNRGWTTSPQHLWHQKILVLPVEIDGISHNGWSWPGRWGKNWKCDSWAWMHMESLLG